MRIIYASLYFLFLFKFEHIYVQYKTKCFDNEKLPQKL